MNAPTPVATQLLHVPGKRRTVALARVAVISHARSWVSSSSRPTKPALQDFIDALTAGQHPAAEELCVIVRRLSVRTLQRWITQYTAGGVLALVPAGGSGRRALVDQSTQLRDHVLRFLNDLPEASPRMVHRHVIATRPELASRKNLRSLQRWIAKYRREERYRVDLVTNPDRAKGRWGVAVGSQSERAPNLNSEWQIDASPSDVSCKDGRSAIVAILDVYSRRVRTLVTKTSTAAAACQLFRQCVREWGAPEVLRTDNGKEFVSSRFQSLLTAAGTEFVLCDPFASEQKGHVERFFGTLSHDLFPGLPGYVGFSVAMRKNIEARKSFAQRTLDASPAIRAELTAAELQEFLDKWTRLYERRPHEGLDKRSPAEVAGAWQGVVRNVDADALDLLDRNYKPRAVTKRGVAWDNGHFHDPELIPWTGKQVLVGADAADRGRVAVLSPEMVFICHAIDPTRAGVSPREFAHKLKAAERLVKNNIRAEERARAPITRESVAADILRGELAAVASIEAMPKRAVQDSTPLLEAAARGAHERTAIENDPFRNGRFPAAVRLVDAGTHKTQADWEREDAELIARQHAELRVLVEREADESLTAAEFERLQKLSAIPGNGTVTESYRLEFARKAARRVAR